LLFQPKDVTRKEEGIGGPDDPEQMAIMVDLKGYSPAYVAPPGMVSAFPRDGAKKEIDNERVTFWDYTWSLNRPVPMHFHDKDAVEVFVQGGTIRTRSRDGHEESKTWAVKDARFVAGNQVDSEEAVSGSPRAIVIELKTQR
jgi:hypothetical protein